MSAKIRRLALALVLLPSLSFAQGTRANIYSTKAQKEFEQALTNGSIFGAPQQPLASFPSCNTANLGGIRVDTTGNALNFCNGSAWAALATGSGFATLSGTNVFSGQNTFNDGASGFTLANVADNTKKVQWDLSTETTATTATFQVGPLGQIRSPTNGTLAAPPHSTTALPSYGWVPSANFLQASVAGTDFGAFNNSVNPTGFNLPSAQCFTWGSGTSLSSPDTILCRRAAATFRFGTVDNAAPIAQTETVTNVVAGTSNTAGALHTYKDSISTGTGIGGGFAWQVTPAGSSGTTQNTQANAMILDGSGHLRFPAVIASPTITAGCGTSPSIVDGSDQAFHLNIGTGGVVATCTVTFNKAFLTKPVCTVMDETSQAITTTGVPATTNIVLTATANWTASSILDVICVGDQ